MSVSEMPRVESETMSDFEKVMGPVGVPRPRRIALGQDGPENGLAKLVLTLIEVIRQLVERQAIRRVEGGSLSEDEVERLGTRLMQLEEEMGRMKKHFGLTDDDLNIDLGPLGKLSAD